jgi:hypothetical protein
MYTAVVLGDFVFVDGGEISQLVNGIPDPGQASYRGYSRQSKQNRGTLNQLCRRGHFIETKLTFSGHR